ncbi:hypothetical protein NXS19_007710 [Fusarium pseudograminearum]|nr:hypothetical protein NXS19_007710 [Fusarium pseudograminearum]
MQPSRSQPRGPGSFNPLSSSSAQPSQLSTASSRPALRRVETSDGEDETPGPLVSRDADIRSIHDTWKLEYGELRPP